MDKITVVLVERDPQLAQLQLLRLQAAEELGGGFEWAWAATVESASRAFERSDAGHESCTNP